MTKSISCRFNSVWDDGYLVTTSARVDLETGQVFDVQVAEPYDDEGDELEVLDREYIDFADLDGDFEIEQDDEGDHYLDDTNPVLCALRDADTLPVAMLGELWEILRDIPVNGNDQIDGAFLHFPKGTAREDVWHWFEQKSPWFSVAEAMGQESASPAP